MNLRISPNRISIGILAYNSASTIESTIRCLIRQSLIAESQPDCLVEILVLPNGCSDNTADLAEMTLTGEMLRSHVSWRICRIAQKGKCNAWNEFVHNFSDDESDILVFMDSDIIFLGEDTLTNLVDTIKMNSQARIAVDKPVKDVALKKDRTWWEWLSLQVSDVSKKDTPSICGQLYAGLSEHLRKIWMPTGLPVEDGFLRAMILTDGFREEESFDRIVRANEAFHRFEAHLGTKDLFSHEEWLVAASTINTFVYDFLWKSCKGGQNGGELIRELNETDPKWLEKLVSQRVVGKHWIVPSRFVFRRFYQMRQFSFGKAVSKIPISLIAFCVDCIICYRVNRTLKRKKGVVRYWRSESTNTTATEVKIFSVPSGKLNDEVHASG